MAGEMDMAGGRRGNRLRAAIWGLAAGLFLLPLVAMQLSTEMNWTIFDFLVWGLMLLVACGTYELLARMSPNRHYRLGVGVSVATGFVVFFVNGAVGMIGDEGNGYNLLFLGAIAVGGVVALVSWFRPAGMVRALYATAILHALVSVVALVAGWDLRGAILSLCFVAPWLFAAGMFRLAVRETPAGAAGA